MESAFYLAYRIPQTLLAADHGLRALVLAAPVLFFVSRY